MLPFKRLHAEERQPEDDRRRHPSHDGLGLAHLRGTHGKGHGHRAEQKDDGVDATKEGIENVARLLEHLLELVPVNGVGAEHATEEKHFGRQEHPHAEVAGIVLLVMVLEMVRQVRGVAVMVAPVGCRLTLGFRVSVQGRAPCSRCSCTGRALPSPRVAPRNCAAWAASRWPSSPGWSRPRGSSGPSRP